MKFLSFGKKAAAALQALTLVVGLGSAGLAVTTVATAGSAYAACSATDGPSSGDPLGSGANCAQANGTRDTLFGQGGVFQTIANTLIFLVGAVAVLFLIIGGLRYVISNGDPKAVEAAKNTILYSIMGIVVAILSFAAVQFVIGAFKS